MSSVISPEGQREKKAVIFVGLVPKHNKSMKDKNYT